MFPRADDVAKYLTRYWLRHAKDATLRLGCVVEKLAPDEVDEDGAPLNWRVEYKDSNGEAQIGKFDYVVFATGFNSKGYMPPLANQPSFKGLVLHGSEYSWDAVDSACQSTPFSVKKIVVVGGSLTASELVGEIALSIASQPPSERVKYELVHLFSRPFWVMPKTIPLLVNNNRNSSPQPRLFPMDWVFYDLKRGDIANFNEYMKVMVGGDQSDLTPELTITGDAMDLPTWVCLSNAYAGFARSGAVNTVIGRLLDFGAEDSYSIMYDTLGQSHSTATLNEVSCVIMATGYTPYYTLQKFLDTKLFETITSHTPDKPIDYTFLPFLLYKQVLHPAFGHTAGCVGLYKGPYFGVMEIQAKWLAALFAGEVEWPTESELNDGIDEMRRRRDGRRSSHPSGRGQWSMGDYVKIMQGYCETLGITWHPPNPDLRRIIDPFVPERLQPTRPTPQSSAMQQLISDIGEKRKPIFVPSAVFRALQGKWDVNVGYTMQQQHRRGEEVVSGQYTAQVVFAGRGRSDLSGKDSAVDPATVQELQYLENERVALGEGVVPGIVYVLQQHGITYRLDLAPTPSITAFITIPPSSEDSTEPITHRVPLQFYAPVTTENGQSPAWHAKGELVEISGYRAWLEFMFWFIGIEVKRFELRMDIKNFADGVTVQTMAKYSR